jgi:hypothetical protein
VTSHQTRVDGKNGVRLDTPRAIERLTGIDSPSERIERIAFKDARNVAPNAHGTCPVGKSFEYQLDTRISSCETCRRNQGPPEHLATLGQPVAFRAKGRPEVASTSRPGTSKAL